MINFPEMFPINNNNKNEWKYLIYLQKGVTNGIFNFVISFKCKLNYSLFKSSIESIQYWINSLINLFLTWKKLLIWAKWSQRVDHETNITSMREHKSKSRKPFTK